MIIAISGSVGVGKTTIAKLVTNQTNYTVIHLNEIAKNFKIEEVPELNTFDFDIDKLRNYIDDYLEGKDNIILEGHFAHLLNPENIDLLVIINRDLTELTKEYEIRGYNDQKKQDNLEVESFNLCFYEALEEGFIEEKVLCYYNDTKPEDIVSKIVTKI